METTGYNATVGQLEGKTVMVTGGARRLGRAIVHALAAAGARVVFTYHSSADEARQLLHHVESSGGQGLSLRCDVRQEADIQQAVAAALERFGRIDLLINNAGVFLTANPQDITAAEWDDVFAVNVRGPFLFSRECIPVLRQVRGRILYMGSLGGQKPWATHAHYCSSKAALHMLTQVMAKGLAPEIAVNCVAPGMIDVEGEKDPALLHRLADRTPMKKNGTVHDVVSAVMYFATAPHFITGQVLTVDGGLGLV